VKRTPLRPVSARRRRRDAAYPSSRREIYDRAGGMCEANVTIRCERNGWQVHHIAGRAGPDPHRLENLELVCAHCHRFIHDNPEWSYANGHMRKRNGAADG